MKPYYEHMHTYGPANPGVNNDGIQFFGAAESDDSSIFNFSKRVTVAQLLQQRPVNLWGMGAEGPTGTQAAAVTAIFSTVVIGGLALNYVLGRYVGSAIVVYVSNNKLSIKQKRAIGVTTLLF